MARIIDETKIERIKEITIKMVVSNGFGGASISEIAHKADVAEGYLYRHYKGKAELVDDLFYTIMNELVDKLQGLIDDQEPIDEIIEKMVRILFDLANHSPEKVKFLYVLMNDYNFRIQKDQQERIFNLCKRVKEMSLAAGTIDPGLNEEEIYLLGVAYPIQFINLRLKSFFYQSQLGEDEIKKVLHICLNSIKSKKNES